MTSCYNIHNRDYATIASPIHKKKSLLKSKMVLNDKFIIKGGSDINHEISNVACYSDLLGGVKSTQQF